jgi:two-component system chemotaxis response regulator CheB
VADLIVVNGQRVARPVVAISASAGGVDAFRRLFEGLDPALPASIVAVIHRSRFAEGALVEVLRRHSALPVCEPTDGDPLEAGRIYLAPRDRHLLVLGQRFHLDDGPRQHSTRPAIDPTFVSVAQSYGARAAAIVLTGAGHDGVAGVIAVKRAGGLALVQEPAEAAHPSMPVETLKADNPDGTVALIDMPRAVEAIAWGREFTVRAPRFAGA